MAAFFVIVASSALVAGDAQRGKHHHAVINGEKRFMMNTTSSPSQEGPHQEGECPPLERSVPKGASNDYAELKQLLKDRDLLDKQPVYYLWRIALIFTLLAGGLVFLAAINILWLQLLDAVYLALVFGQIGLLSHEAGHHHLFPSMARNKLKQAQPIVKAFCLAHALPYHETSVSQSFTEIFRYLHHIGAPLRSSSIPDGWKG